MYGLPIFRKETISNPPPPCPDLFGCCVGAGCPPPKLKSGLKLAQMLGNHYSLIISADYRQLAAWGGSASYGTVGVTANYNKPKTSTINWDKGRPRLITKVYSFGNQTGTPVTVFRTEDNQLYGTGNLPYIINQPSATNTFNLISDNVIDFCISGNQYMLYIKADNKLYGLGPATVGFGFPASKIKAIPKDDGVSSSYLGVSSAAKVFTTSPNNSNSKSFVLKQDGTVLACGYNTDGCLGVNKTDNIIYEWDYVKTSTDGGLTFKNLSGVVDVVTTNYVYPGGANAATGEWSGGAGSGHMSTYFLTKDGSVYTCGNNKFGQLGLGLATSQTRNYAVKTSITKGSLICTTAGGTSVLVTTTDDEVYTWGNNQWGQLGNGTLAHQSTATKITFPKKKIQMIHGGGMYGIINGAFLIVCADGSVYGAGYNGTYALGISNAGIPNAGPITIFTKNEFFGVNPPQNQDPERYPLLLNGNLSSADILVRNALLSADKTVLGSKETVYVLQGMAVSGYGIQPETYVKLVNLKTNEVTLSKPATATTIKTDIRYDKVIYVYQADLCGYGTEMAQKVVTEDGTLYMSGWNQSTAAGWNFNYYIGTENVSVPTFFDAKKFL